MNTSIQSSYMSSIIDHTVFMYASIFIKWLAFKYILHNLFVLFQKIMIFFIESEFVMSILFAVLFFFCFLYLLKKEKGKSRRAIWTFYSLSYSIKDPQVMLLISSIYGSLHWSFGHPKLIYSFLSEINFTE